MTSLPMPTPQTGLESCSGGDVALIVALVSAVFAFLAVLQARRANSLAADELSLVKKEHEAFLKTINARSDLRALMKIERLQVDPDDPDVILVTGTSGSVTIALGFRNHGDARATETTLNVVFPRSARRAEWTYQDGTPRGDVDRRGPARTEEFLDDGTGREIAANYLTHNIPVINKSSHYARYVTLAPEWPQAPGDETHLPVKFTLEADEQPEGQTEIACARVFRLRQAPDSDHQIG
jgi:hypothetical protein